MNMLDICFWMAAACVVYTCVGYPVLLAILARFRPRPPGRLEALPTSVSVVIAAHNEAEAIDRRLKELTELIAIAGVRGEVIVVSDGSLDGTAARARAFPADNVHVVELPANSGKAEALNAGCAAAVHEIIVFADTRQSWAPDALGRLLGNFADAAVGAVSGDLVVESAPGVMSGVGLYWRYEKWLRRKESQVHSIVGATGAISAVRRELFKPIPNRTLLDDVYWPLQVAMQGYRIVHESQACAYDRLPERARDEFCRKVRTLSGNFQLLTRLPAALLPWRNPIWFQLLSHKLLRLVVPWALLTLLVSSAFLPGPLYRMALVGQITFYALGLLGMWAAVGSRSRLASAPGSFLVLNAAAWLAFWVWLLGKAGRSWRKITYQRKPIEPCDFSASAPSQADGLAARALTSGKVGHAVGR